MWVFSCEPSEITGQFVTTVVGKTRRENQRTSQMLTDIDVYSESETDRRHIWDFQHYVP